ncbi:MAG: hypothetical protein PHS14_08710 [Elusimicrobia bacterium]|nr:hypothetical protein [Elusimicrobiota bacterium]
MTKHAASKLLMAAALAIPVFARAQVVGKSGPACGVPSGEMTAAAAKAALGAAAAKADENALQLAKTPVEYAGMTAGVPYGAEGDMICVKDNSLAGFMETMHKKSDYWKAVRDALVMERSRLQAEGAGPERSVDAVVAGARRSVRLDREIRAAGALAADADKDIVMIKKIWAAAHDREKNDEILARKAEIFKQLQALKGAP